MVSVQDTNAMAMAPVPMPMMPQAQFGQPGMMPQNVPQQQVQMSPQMMPQPMPSQMQVGQLQPQLQQQQQQAQQQQAQQGMNEIKTLFIAGLPYDASDRELYLLFGPCEGYDKSMIVRKDDGKRPYGFVNFTSVIAAEAAKAKLDGFQWDPQESLRLKCELSRKNTPDWFTAACASSASITRRLACLPRNPKTLYVTGVPETVSKELFDAFVVTNFVGQVGGMRYTPPTEKKNSFAFVGFLSHEQAKTAMERLEGYVWTHEGESSTLHATFANTEWNPQSARN